MIVELSPLVVNVIFGCGFAFVGSMIGYNYANYRRDDVIETTILYLVDNNYVKAKQQDDGELELLKLNEE